MSVIKIIIGSTRPHRFGATFAAWFSAVAAEYASTNPSGPRFETVDIADLGLPLLDEAIPASMKKYEHEHTKKWSKIIDEADGFVFLAPEYNHGMSGALKNAIDYLFYEWNYKPAAFASYGGGAGGVRAVEQLRQVMGELKVYDIRESVLIPNYWGQFDAKGAFQANEDQRKAVLGMLTQLAYWTEAMKAPRQALAAKA